MTKNEIMEMAEAYRKKHGFSPGAIVITKKDIPGLLEVYREILLPQTYEALKTAFEENPEIVSKYRLFNMGIVLSDKDEPVHVTRSSGNVIRIKPQDASELYNPAADITNCLPIILKAALAFFDDLDENREPEFFGFVKGCAGFLADVHDEDKTWENHALGELDRLCANFSESSASGAFYKKFFLCVMDHYWHSARLAKCDMNRKTDKDLIKKISALSSIIRTMPKGMREEYLDHIASNGIMPDIMND